MVENLRLRTLNNINGYRGVYFDRVKNRYFSYVYDAETKKRKRSKGFFTAKEAAQAYDEMAREKYGDSAFFNFPLNGEKGVIPIDKDGYCVNGHKRSDNKSKDGQCKACNRMAAKRYKQKIKLLEGK